MSEMITVEKAGMLVNADKEVVGWVKAGEQVEMKEGDLVVSHPKTAEKHGLSEQYSSLKAENTPAKAKKEKNSDGEGKTRTRTVCPTEGAYTVVKADAAKLKEGETPSVRNELLGKLLNGTSFEAFWADAPESFEHPARDGSVKTFKTSGLVTYAINRGMITING